jgi:tetratricopeptide (TPR) repeat protein
VTPTSDTGLRVRALADQAVAAALEADWTRAGDLNAKIIEAAPDDVEARNRMGRVLLEQGKLEEAKASFAEVLKAEPNNSIAIRGTQRLAQLLEHKTKPNVTTSRTQPRLFIEDMGKTGILRVINPAPPHILARYSAGAEAQLKEQEGLLAVHARDGELLGFLEPKVGRRLIDLIRTGNQYVVAIVSNDQLNARVAIREVLQSVENSSRISFPGHHRPAETKERAYIKGNFFRFGRDADEDGDEDTDETEEVEGGAGGEALEETDTVEEPLVVDTGDDDAEEEEEE